MRFPFTQYSRKGQTHKQQTVNKKTDEGTREEKTDEKWMDCTDELWEKSEKARRGKCVCTFDQMGPGLLCESSRCPEILGHRNAPSR